MPFVSVILPTFNRRSSLERALNSIRAQTEVDWELIVVDDGSTDETAEFLNQLERDWPGPQRLVVRRQSNQGVSHARNEGVRLARGEWLAFLDSDDEWLPQKLAWQREVSSDFQWIHGEEIWWRLGREVKPKTYQRKSGGRIFSRCAKICCVSTTTVMIRRQVFTGFREDFPVCEDYELYLRLAENYSAGFVGKAVAIKHGGHADQLSRQFHSMDYFRLKALLPFLESVAISENERQIVAQTIHDKAEILLKGFEKHQNPTHAEFVRAAQDQARKILTAFQITHSAADNLPRSEPSLIL